MSHVICLSLKYIIIKNLTMLFTKCNAQVSSTNSHFAYFIGDNFISCRFQNIHFNKLQLENFIKNRRTSYYFN